MEDKDLSYSTDFKEIVEGNTRKQFEEQFEISSGSLYYRDEETFDSVACPFANGCPLGDSCHECWEQAIEEATFKDEGVINAGDKDINNIAKFDLEYTSEYKKESLPVPIMGCRIAINDPYLDQDTVYERLLREYREHKSLIIAFDYDDTVFDFHSKGRTYTHVMEALRRWKDKAKFICFTGNTPDKYVDIMKYLLANNIPVDRINEGFEGLPNGTHKPYYNILLDDRAGLSEAYNVLNRVYFTIEREGN